MSAEELGSDRENRPLEEMTEIKELLKVLIQSQAKLAEAQAKSQVNIQNQMLEQAKSQENLQSKMLEVLISINSAGNKHQDDDGNDDNNDKQPSKVEEDLLLCEGDSEETKQRVAEYNPNANDLLSCEGDCEETIEFLKKNPEAVHQGVTSDSRTVLHLAISRKREMKLVREIVKLMPPESLEYRSTGKGFTALRIAAEYGNLEACKLMVNKHSRLPLILDADGYTAFETALSFVTVRQKEVAEYLYGVTKAADPTFFSGANGVGVLCALINANFYDLAFRHVKQFPVVVKDKKIYKMCGLEMMARRPFAFRSGTKLTWWQDLIYSLIQVDNIAACIQPDKSRGSECTNRDEENPQPQSLDCTEVEESSKVSSIITNRGIFVPYYLRRVFGIERLYNQKVAHQQAIALIKQMFKELDNTTNKSTLLEFMKDNPNILKEAIKNGITEFVAECLDKFEYLIWHKTSEAKPLEMAIAERKEIIVNLICDIGDKLEEKIDLVTRTDDDDNTILHHAAKLAPYAQLNLVSGAALQMQREMQWFKGVESILRESDRFKRNKKGDTAQIIFTMSHKDLMKEGAEWLQDTSGSCMIVAALVATVAFAAAFTVPGGNISDSNNILNGTPIYLGKPSFTIFAVADTLALFSSITSVLMFLAIYTSRYAEMDFLKSLPQKLIFGLVTLFISMVAILVAFGTSMFIVVGSRFGQALIPIALLSCFPLGLFAWLQLPLFVEMVRSTYWGSLFRKHRYMDLSLKKNVNKLRGKRKEN
ncbi:hypothetical protein MKW92_046991 [Papaver armeniacum]|nr:hypothetical protein MKW92_046991 [Papaver armeniacum]